MKHELSLNTRHCLRVAMATMIAIIIGHVFAIPKAYWLTISALVVLQPSIGATLLRAKQRSISTLVGVLIGAMITILTHQLFWLTALIGLFSLFLGVYFSSKDYLKTIFFLSILVMIMMGLFATNIWQFVFYRFFDTLLGVIIGFVLSLILWPVSAKSLLQQDFLKLIQHYRQLSNAIFDQFISFSHEGQLAIGRSRVEIYADIKLAKQHFEDMQHELDLLNIKRATGFAVVTLFEKFRMTSFAINSISSARERLPAGMIAYLGELKHAVDKLLGQYEFLLMQKKLTTQIGLNFIPSSRLPVFPQEERSLEFMFLQHNIFHLENELNHLYHACRQFLMPANDEAMRVV